MVNLLLANMEGQMEKTNMSKSVAWFFALFTAFFILSACHVPAHATTVKLEPTMQSLNAGDETTVRMNVQNVENLYGFQVKLVYDPSVISEVRAAKGPFLSGGFGTFTDGSVVTDSASPKRTRLLGMTLQGSVPGKGGSGTLVTFTLKTKGPGTSSLSLANLILIDAAGTQIPATAGTSQIVVTGSAVPAPGPEPTPPDYEPPIDDEEMPPMADVPPYPPYEEEFAGEPPYASPGGIVVRRPDYDGPGYRTEYEEGEMAEAFDQSIDDAEYLSPSKSAEEGFLDAELPQPDQADYDSMTEPKTPFESKRETRMAVVEPDMPKRTVPEVAAAPPVPRKPYEETFDVTKTLDETKVKSDSGSLTAFIFKAIALLVVLGALVLVLKKLKIF